MFIPGGAKDLTIRSSQSPFVARLNSSVTKIKTFLKPTPVVSHPYLPKKNKID
jgi:hypothetical protein